LEELKIKKKRSFGSKCLHNTVTVYAESGIFTAFVLLAEEAPDRGKNPAKFVPKKQTSVKDAVQIQYMYIYKGRKCSPSPLILNYIKYPYVK
jgi:hypothetical protein